MAAELPLECGVCHEEFDEDVNRPRLMPCSHRVCSSCLQNLIRSNGSSLLCPFCRKKFSASTPENLPADNDFIKLLLYIKNQEATNRPIGRRPTSHELIQCEYLKLSEEKQLVLSKKFKDIIQITEERINALLNKLLDNEERGEQIGKWLKKFHSTNENRINDIGKRCENLKALCQLLEDHEKQLLDVEYELNGKTNFTDAGPLFDKRLHIVKTNEDTLRKLIGTLYEEARVRHNIEKDIRVAALNVRSVMQVLQLDEVNEGDQPASDVVMTEVGPKEREQLEEQAKELEEITSLSIDLVAVALQHRPDDVTIDVFWSMNGLVRKLLEEGRILAFKDLPGGGLRRYARISLSKDKDVFLHHLKEEKLPTPNEVYLIKHEDLIKNPSDILFLDLSADGEILGKLHIKLNHQGNFSLNFKKLCTGQDGPSYALSNIIQNEDGKIHFGDYELNNGNGGKAVVPKVSWGKEFYEEIGKTACKAGSLIGVPCWEDKTVSQFIITAMDKPNEIIAGCFGVVEKGLDVLTGAISRFTNETIRQITISDCGMILLKPKQG